MKHTSCQNNRRGFATIMAIMLIILVGAILAMLATFFVAEARRTRSEAADAQLRQLLTAAAAMAMSDPNLDQNYLIEIPAQLQQAEASVSATRSNDVASVVIEAKLGKRKASEVLTFKREGERWVLTGVTQM